MSKGNTEGPEHGMIKRARAFKVLRGMKQFAQTKGGEAFVTKSVQTIIVTY